jgi:hypothetical protein
VPPENDTVADSRGRFGSGGVYAAGHAVAAGDGVGRGLGLGAAEGLGLVATVAVAVSEGDAESAASGPPEGGVDVLQPATSAAITTHEVRTHRR